MNEHTTAYGDSGAGYGTPYQRKRKADSDTNNCAVMSQGLARWGVLNHQNISTSYPQVNSLFRSSTQVKDMPRYQNLNMQPGFHPLAKAQYNGTHYTAPLPRHPYPPYQRLQPSYYGEVLPRPSYPFQSPALKVQKRESLGTVRTQEMYVLEARKSVFCLLLHLFKQAKKDKPWGIVKSLALIVERLLFVRAVTFHEYTNVVTLKLRVLAVAKEILTNSF